MKICPMLRKWCIDKGMKERSIYMMKVPSIGKMKKPSVDKMKEPSIEQRDIKRYENSRIQYQCRLQSRIGYFVI